MLDPMQWTVERCLSIPPPAPPATHPDLPMFLNLLRTEPIEGIAPIVMQAMLGVGKGTIQRMCKAAMAMDPPQVEKIGRGSAVRYRIKIGETKS